MNRRPLRPGEKALWERIARTVEPLKRRSPPPAAKPRAKEVPKAAELPPQPVSPEPPVPAPSITPKAPRKRAAPPHPGDLDRNLRRRLARGGEAIDARLDLHGMTQEEAHGALLRFIGASQQAGRRTVLVITGKGRGGEGMGILRRAVPHWLASRELQRLVVSFGPAHHTHGGDGAFYVRLRSSRRLRR